MSRKSPESDQIERCLLATFFQDPGWLGEVSDSLKTDFFAYSVHQKVYSAIKSLYKESKTIDKHILISRLNLMGLTSIDGLDTSDYIESIAGCIINIDSKIAYLDEVTKLHWARVTWKKLTEARDFIEKSLKNTELTFKDILSGAEKIVTDALTFQSVDGDDEAFIDLNGEMERLLDERCQNKGLLGITTPFPSFNRWFGPLLHGGLYVFAASSKVGKSTFLSALANHAIEEGSKREKGVTKILFLDTEMRPEEVACRNMASESGVNAFFYLNGKFTEDPAKIEKTQEALPKFQSRKGTMYHRYIPDADTDKIESIVRRFHSRHIGPDDTLTIILDYFKISAGEDRNGGGTQQLKEYELIGAKVNKMKMLAESLSNTVSLAAVQLNRQDEIAQSARILWFSTGVFSIARKSPEEIGQEGKKHGTHKLVKIVARNQGEFPDEGEPFKIENGNGEAVWRENEINLDFSNFKVTETSTRKQAYESILKSGQRPIRETASEKQKAQLRTYAKF